MIPETFVKEYLEKAEGCTLFGTPIKDLSRDELIACVIMGWEGEAAARKDSKRSMDFMLFLNRQGG